MRFQGIVINAGDPHLAFEMRVCKMSYFPKLVPSSSELTTGPEPPSCPTTLTTAGCSPSRTHTITSFG